MKTILTLLTILAVTFNLHGAEPVAKHLLLDDRVIERIDNARLTLGPVKKHAGNSLFGEDKPWEKRFDNLYANVLHDETDGLYKCWYLSADVAPGGSIRVAVEGDAARTLVACEPVTTTVTAAPVKWQAGKPLGTTPVVLRFELTKARLYSFWFGESGSPR